VTGSIFLGKAENRERLLPRRLAAARSVLPLDVMLVPCRLEAGGRRTKAQRFITLYLMEEIAMNGMFSGRSYRVE
jgi:hypothetical protein